MQITEEQFELLVTKFKDKLWRLENLYTIKNKRGAEVPFRLNPDQLLLYHNKHNKNVILKARQRGITTYQCISFLDDCLFIPNLSAGIIAHKVEDAQEFFEDKIKFAYDRLDPMIKSAITADTDSAGKLKFSNGSSIRVSTSFRSGTLQRLHVSEYGKIAAEFPKKAKEIRTGAFNAVSLDQEITVESTAEGMEGEFYTLWGKAESNEGKKLTALDFKPFFFAWWKAEEYRLDPAGIEIPLKLKNYFEMLKNEHGISLDDHQKAWYVKKSDEQGDDMAQEYPSFSEESFIVSGRPVFDKEKISADIKRAKDIKFITGAFVGGHFVKDDHGPYKIFKAPQEGKRYGIGGDVAEGLEDGDYSTQSVLNKSLEQVACYHDHTHPALFGAEMIHTGRYYNDALLAPEINNHGLTTLTCIADKNYPYLYMREVWDERTNALTKKAGWRTDVRTKPLMLDELIAAYNGHGDYNECPVKVNDVATLREMLSLKYEPDGSVNLNGKDRVVGLCIALQAIKQVAEVVTRAYDTVNSKMEDMSFTEMLTVTESHNGETYDF